MLCIGPHMGRCFLDKSYFWRANMKKKPTEALAALQKGSFLPVYIFAGGEGYFMDKADAMLQQALLKEEEKAFNLDIFYGPETTAEAILSAARSYPLMAERRLVLVREAQGLKKPEWAKLAAYLQQPAQTTVLALLHRNKALDGRSKITQLANKSQTVQVVDCQPLSEEALVDFIVRYAAEKELRFHPRAAFALKELLGTNLSRVVSEIDKIALAVPPNAEIQLQEVADRVGMSREFNIFDLPGLLAEGNHIRVLRMAFYMAKNPNMYPLPMMVGTFYNFFSKLFAMHSIYFDNHRRQKRGEAPQDPLRMVRMFYEPRVIQSALKVYDMGRTAKALHVIREFDHRSKGMGTAAPTPDGELLKEFLWKLLNV